MSSPLRFERAPRRVYWEMTRACDLACRHCRAEAAAEPDPVEPDPAPVEQPVEETSPM